MFFYSDRRNDYRVSHLWFSSEYQAGQVKPDKVGDEEVDMPACTVSYKPQELISKISSTVRELLQKKIPGSCSQAQFRSDVMKPLKIEELMDRQVANLSGGELQRVALCLCLGKVRVHLITPHTFFLSDLLVQKFSLDCHLVLLENAMKVKIF